MPELSSISKKGYNQEEGNFFTRKKEGDSMSTVTIPLQNQEGTNQELQQITQPAQEKQNATAFLTCYFSQISSHVIKIRVEIDPKIVETVYTETIHFFKQKNYEGFDYNKIPLDYIEDNFIGEINTKLKSYLFRHLVTEYIMTEIMKQKIAFANYPRLINIEIAENRQITFFFDLSIADSIELKEWKHFAFKSPRRKRYKDLDKQVHQFIEQESDPKITIKNDTIEESDWVLFETTLLDQNFNPTPYNITSGFWIKIKKSEIPDNFKTLFIGKKLNESFITNKFDLDDFSNDFDNKYYNFLITINNIIKGSSTSLELFKQTFKLKNKTELHNKLMEVFSYRNDLSQRKTIIEEVFTLLLAKHRFEVPKHLVLRRQEDILSTIIRQPDYQVYKAQQDFIKQTESLAEKQLKEEIIIDQISYQENIKVEPKDILQYLHLLNNKRLKEFIYFKPSFEKIDDVEIPINNCLLAQSVMREKTLNFIIYALTR